ADAALDRHASCKALHPRSHRNEYARGGALSTAGIRREATIAVLDVRRWGAAALRGGRRGRRPSTERRLVRYAAFLAKFSRFAAPRERAVRDSRRRPRLRHCLPVEWRRAAPRRPPRSASSRNRALASR